jgi:hypothetical protein
MTVPRETWKHGWPTLSDWTTMLIGTGVHCVACGTLLGITTVAFPPGWTEPGPTPDWPFEEATCPLRQLLGKEAHP